MVFDGCEVFTDDIELVKIDKGNSVVWMHISFCYCSEFYRDSRAFRLGLEEGCNILASVDGLS